MLWRKQQQLGGFVISAWPMCSWHLNSLFKRRRQKDYGLHSAPEMETWENLCLLGLWFSQQIRFLGSSFRNLRRGLMSKFTCIYSCIDFTRILYQDFVWYPTPIICLARLGAISGWHFATFTGTKIFTKFSRRMFQLAEAGVQCSDVALSFEGHHPPPKKKQRNEKKSVLLSCQMLVVYNWRYGISV